MEDVTRGGTAQLSAGRNRRKRIGWAAGLIAAGALAGGLVATALPATADPSTDPSASSSSSSTESRPGAGAPGGARGAGGQRSDETLLTGADADKAKAAALKAVPGATIDRVETDADGAVYEAHVTKSDGSKATVKFDKDFNVTAVQAGMGSHK